MAELDAVQRGALERIRRARAAEREARASLEARIRAELAGALEALHDATLDAVRHAHDAGVPIRRIGTDGLGTSDYATVKRLLAESPAAIPAEPDIRPADAAERRAGGVLDGETAYSLRGVLAVLDTFGEWRIPAERRAATPAECAALEAAHGTMAPA